MPRGSKEKYTDKQKRKAGHIEESYEERGVPDKEAERRAWATVNKQSGGGKKSGSGRKGSGAKKTSTKKSETKKTKTASRRGKKKPGPKPGKRKK